LLLLIVYFSAEGVEIRIELVGDPDASTYVTTNSAGEYIAGPFVHSSGFQVTPEMSGYSFIPKKDDPYSFTVSQLAKIRVKIAQKLPSVLLSLSGPNSYRYGNRITFGIFRAVTVEHIFICS